MNTNLLRPPCAQMRDRERERIISMTRFQTSEENGLRLCCTNDFWVSLLCVRYWSMPVLPPNPTATPQYKGLSSLAQQFQLYPSYLKAQCIDHTLTLSGVRGAHIHLRPKLKDWDLTPCTISHSQGQLGLSHGCRIVKRELEDLLRSWLRTWILADHLAQGSKLQTRPCFENVRKCTLPLHERAL